MPIGKLTVVHTVEEMEEEACSHQKQGLPSFHQERSVVAAEVVAAADADAAAMRRAGAGRGGRGGARSCREPGRNSRALERLLATSSAEAQQSVQQAEARQGHWLGHQRILRTGLIGGRAITGPLAQRVWTNRQGPLRDGRWNALAGANLQP